MGVFVDFSQLWDLFCCRLTQIFKDFLIFSEAYSNSFPMKLFFFYSNFFSNLLFHYKYLFFGILSYIFIHTRVLVIISKQPIDFYFLPSSFSLENTWMRWWNSWVFSTNAVQMLFQPLPRSQVYFLIQSRTEPISTPSPVNVVAYSKALPQFL